MADDSIPLHGGQLREIAERFQVLEESLLDFSASISPIPPGDDMIDALSESLRSRKVLTQYPDKEYRDLKHTIAQYAGVNPGSICVANGVMPLLDAAVRAFGLRRCLVLVPAFGEYERILRACGVEHRTLLLREEDSFRVNSDAVIGELNSSGADALLFANPHSPSSSLTSAHVLTQLQLTLSALGVTMIVDEAFIDYSPDASLSALAESAADVVVLRSLTKFFAMPGLRVAYAVVHPESRTEMETMLPLWPVDSLAASAACLALLDTALVRKTLEANAVERTWLIEKLISLGLHVSPGSANYLLVRLPDSVDGLEIWRRLITERQIVLRNCATFEGLTGQYFRIAVRDRFANQVLTSALASVL